MAPTFMGGALKLKGAKKKKKKSKHSKAEETAGTKTKISNEFASPVESDEELTMAEKLSLKRKKERESIELEKIAKQSHRERIEEFNEKLGSLTELNDIPRVSAAGNG
jgi:protein FAM32A